MEPVLINWPKPTTPDEERFASEGRQFLNAYLHHAYSLRQRDTIRRAFEQWMDERGYRPYYEAKISGVGHGWLLDEERAESNDSEGERLGLTDAELKERSRMGDDLHFAQTQEEVDDVRARLENWLTRFPDDCIGAHWREALNTQQTCIDIMTEIGGAFEPNPWSYAVFRAQYSDPFAPESQENTTG